MVVVVGTRNVRAAQCFIARIFVPALRINDMNPPFFEWNAKSGCDASVRPRVGIGARPYGG